MPTLDFTDVLLSPKFTDQISVTQETRTIGSDGVATTLSTSTTLLTAIVDPGKGDLVRLPDGTRVTNYIEVYIRGDSLTTGHRISDAQERVADIVTWHGAPYVVCSTNDFSGFGSGFIKASCDLVMLNPNS